MNITVSKENDFSIVRVEGRVDISTAKVFEAQMNALIEAGCIEMIVDCSDLVYISSSGLKVLIALQRQLASSQGKITLCSLQPGIAKIFEISGFGSIFPIFTDTETARRAL
jgi:anti-anti-sigma factor